MVLLPETEFKELLTLLEGVEVCPAPTGPSLSLAPLIVGVVDPPVGRAFDGMPVCCFFFPKRKDMAHDRLLAQIYLLSSNTRQHWEETTKKAMSIVRSKASKLLVSSALGAAKRVSRGGARLMTEARQ